MVILDNRVKVIPIITRKVVMVVVVILAEEKKVGSTCLDFTIKVHLSDQRQSHSLTRSSVKC